MKFVWIDLEMTGLNQERDRVLEVGVLITDENGRPISPEKEWVLYQDEKILNSMDEWCTTQHTKTGLVELVRASKNTEKIIEGQLYTFITQHCTAQEGILAGNSVWQDRIFLARFFPKVLSYLHYRILDVSAIKSLVNAWYTGDPRLPYKKKELHRVSADIQESIAELLFYRANFFLQRDHAWGKKERA
jgi:oligoribonuclease